MGWQPMPCNGTLAEIESSWRCMSCGLEGDWDAFSAFMNHVALPPRYSESMDAAWLVVRGMNTPDSSAFPNYQTYSRFIDQLEKIVGSDLFFDLFYCDQDGDHL